MIFANKSKRQMYLTVLKFHKCKDIKETENYICKKLNITDIEFSQIIYECVSSHFFDGIKCSGSMSNKKYNVYSQHIFITYFGYEFLKNYHGFIKKVLWELFLIITTAFVTVLITNKFSISDKYVNISDNIVSQYPICPKICYYTYN